MDMNRSCMRVMNVMVRRMVTRAIAETTVTVSTVSVPSVMTIATVHSGVVGRAHGIVVVRRSLLGRQLCLRELLLSGLDAGVLCDRIVRILFGGLSLGVDADFAIGNFFHCRIGVDRPILNRNDFANQCPQLRLESLNLSGRVSRFGQRGNLIAFGIALSQQVTELGVGVLELIHNRIPCGLMIASGLRVRGLCRRERRRIQSRLPSLSNLPSRIDLGCIQSRLCRTER